MLEAADWLVKQQERTLTDTEQEQLEKWLQSDRNNQFAWQRAQRFISQIDTLPKDIAYTVLNRPDDENRRLHIGKLALILASGPLVWGSYKTIETQQWTADYRTAKGQQKQITLPDGTTVKLNTATAFDISFNGKSRLLSLREGEIQVHTATTSSQELKPLIVQTQEAVLSPTEANFTVRQYNEMTRVGIVKGPLKVTPKFSNNAQGAFFDTGHQIELSSHAFLSDNALKSETTSWLDNMLAVHNMPLKQFIEEVSRYHRGRLRVSPDIENIDVSGAFPLQDINIIFNMLSHTYPININSHLGNYWVTLEAT